MFRYIYSFIMNCVYWILHNGNRKYAAHNMYCTESLLNGSTFLTYGIGNKVPDRYKNKTYLLNHVMSEFDWCAESQYSWTPWIVTIYGKRLDEKACNGKEVFEKWARKQLCKTTF